MMGDCRLRFRVSNLLWIRLSTSSKLDDNDDESKEVVAEYPRAGGAESEMNSVVPVMTDYLLSTPVITSVWSADTTIQEVLEKTNLCCTQQQQSPPTEQWSLRYLLENQMASLWDCTVYPTTNLSTILFHNDDDYHKNLQRTLYDLGWFPSANLQLLPFNATTAIVSSSDIYEDQYNLPQIQKPNDEKNNYNNNQAQRVELIQNDHHLPLPSQVLHSVTTRFDHEERLLKNDNDDAAAIRLENRIARQQSEQKRAHKLEEWIRKLQEQIENGSKQQQQDNNKKKAVSDQVRKMLIKSRATGRKELKMQDRLYFHCIFWIEDVDENSHEQSSGSASVLQSNTQDFRYFSPQDTVGRVLESFPKPKVATSLNLETEMLVSVSTEQTADGGNVIEYRRLPLLLRFYEAIEKKYLTGSVDTVVIRWFNPQQHEPTTLISEPNTSTMTNADDLFSCSGDSRSEGSVNENMAIQSTDDTMKMNVGCTLVSCDYLTSVLKSFEDGTKKNKSTAAKVREMKMKSQAKGDTKRIKMNDRFFLELITVILESSEQSRTNIVPSSSFVFVSRSDSLDRLVRELIDKSTNLDVSYSWDILAVKSGANGSSYSFPMIASSSNDDSIRSTTWELAERQGKISCFSRAVVVFR